MKPVLASKTVWASLAAIIAGVLAVPEILAVIPLAWMPYLLAANGVIGIVLRVFFTDTAVKHGAETP